MKFKDKKTGYIKDAKNNEFLIMLYSKYPDRYESLKDDLDPPSRRINYPPKGSPKHELSRIEQKKNLPKSRTRKKKSSRDDGHDPLIN
ncbi:MAG: hypothetical protein FWC41_00270 [Firmicutes bacterium]|nr:hypothetical protein [Bacillota bacterium]